MKIKLYVPLVRYLAVAYIVAIICIYYYTAAYNTPETHNYDCVSYDVRSNPK